MKGEKAHRHVEGYEGWECAAFLTSGVFLFLAEGFFSAGTMFSSRSGGHARQLPNPQWEQPLHIGEARDQAKAPNTRYPGSGFLVAGPIQMEWKREPKQSGFVYHLGVRIEWLMADLAIKTSGAAKAAVKTHYPVAVFNAIL